MVDIAVIDDDAEVRNTLVAMVKRLSYSSVGIDPNSDVMAALSVIRPSTIILDLSLGRRDAVQVLHDLAHAAYGGRVLLVSGRDRLILERVYAIGIRCGLEMLAPLVKPLRARDIGASLSAASALRCDDAELTQFDLAEAVEQRWLEVWYQPKVNLRTRALCGAEALIRLRHPKMGIIGPAAFIPAATDAAYEAATAFVMESIARDWTVLRRRGWTLAVSMNASIRMIQRPSFLDMVRSAWLDVRDRPRLIVEVTEDELVVDLVAAQEIATQLKLYDVDISIDDFGSGYSSFARLRDLPFSELKLDKSFVIGCGSDDRQRAFCEATAALARQFEISSVAEGIETAEDLAVVEAAGFNAGQGYFFGRPKPLGEFIEALGDDRIRSGRTA